MERTPVRPRVYVASSWRNNMQTAVVHAIRAAGFPVYDFKDETIGFHWSDVNPTYKAKLEGGELDFQELEAMLDHPAAWAGFARDFTAMQQCDTMVMVLPCGRSAHLELGWAVGAGKRTCILNMEETPEPDLMVKMADYRCDSIMDVLAWLGVDD
jgi:hypothetical protein